MEIFVILAGLIIVGWFLTLPGSSGGSEYHKPPDIDDNPPTPTPSPDQKDN